MSRSIRYLLLPALLLSITAFPASASTSYQLKANTWTLTTVGDIMLDRYVHSAMLKNGAMFPFAKITNELKGSDVALGNLEGPFTANRSIATNTKLIFTFDPKYASTLKQVGFTTLSLANNHTLNFSQAGLQSTRTTLQKSGLDFFGDPQNKTNYHLTKTLGGRQVTFLGYHGLVGGLDSVLTDIHRAHQKGEYVIIMAHAGTEYNLKFSSAQQRDYKQLIDAGADMVLGAHPHVVEPIEIYKGKLIAYSLGNFVFDQYFSADTQQELMLKMKFTNTAVTVTLVPLMSIRSQVQVATQRMSATMLNRLATSSIVPTNIRQNIRDGQFTLSTL